MYIHIKLDKLLTTKNKKLDCKGRLVVMLTNLMDPNGSGCGYESTFAVFEAPVDLTKIPTLHSNPNFHIDFATVP